MSLVGRLEELSVAEILHMIAWGEKTGKLTISRGNAVAVVVFHRGRIVYAASNSPRQSLGSILVCRSLVSEDGLMGGIDEQNRRGDGSCLGAVLIEMGALTTRNLETAVREQIEQVIAEFFLWESGGFRFEALELPDAAVNALDATSLQLDRGFSADQVVLEVVKKVDDARRRREDYAASSRRAAPRVAGDAPLRMVAAPPPRRDAASLQGIMAEVQAPALRGEAVLTILRHARRLLSRAVLFVPTYRGFAGIGQFGVELSGAPADEQIRELLIPIDQPSVLGDVMSKRGTYRGILSPTFWNDFLLQELGGILPREVVAVPAVAGGEVVAILYGDSASSGEPIGGLAGLESAVGEACARYIRTPAPGARNAGSGRPAPPGSSA